MKTKYVAILAVAMLMTGMVTGGMGAILTLPITAPILFHTSIGQGVFAQLQQEFGGSNGGGNNNNNQCQNCGNNQTQNNCQNCSYATNQTQNNQCQNCNNQTYTNQTQNNYTSSQNSCLGGSTAIVNQTGTNSCSGSLSPSQSINQQVQFEMTGSFSITITSSQNVQFQVSGSSSKTGTSITVSGSFSNGEQITMTLVNLESTQTTYTFQVQIT